MRKKETDPGSIVFMIVIVCLLTIALVVGVRHRLGLCECGGKKNVETPIRTLNEIKQEVYDISLPLPLTEKEKLLHSLKNEIVEKIQSFDAEYLKKTSEMVQLQKKMEVKRKHLKTLKNKKSLKCGKMCEICGHCEKHKCKC